MITTIEDAQHEVWAMEQDALADAVDEETEYDHRDFVVSASFMIGSDDLCRELCRVELGFIPWELQPRLGKTDWLDS